ncbi:MAG TPA: ATP-binding protein [Anaerolineales bacterium]|nr:ATP-binding protein [Anaerolineales bacterium]
MITNFYPPYLRQLFTNRARELDFLQSLVTDLLAGKPRRLAVWGLRRVGKTLVIQEQIARMHDQGVVHPVYMDFEDICTAPELFAQRYIGLVTFWALENGQGDVDAYLTVERLLEAVAGRSVVASQTAGSLLRELSRTKPDQALLLKLAFEYPEKLAQELNKKLVLFLDEFTEISTLGHYPQVREPLKHFRAALTGQTNVAYVVAGSAMTAMMKLFQSPEAPLFLQFETLALEPFGRQDAEVLMRKLGSEYSPGVYAEVYRYTAGFPFYITALMQRLERLQQSGEVISADSVRYAFLLETLWRGGQIYNYCRYVYDLSLQRARGYGMLKAILQFLAEEQGFTLSEIARSLRKSPSAVREYLRWLSEVDLVEEREHNYQFRDPILRFWVAYTSKGIEMDAFPRREDLAGLVADLEERFQRAAGELGRAKEAEIRELMRRFAGQVVPGALLGQEGDLALPVVRSVDGYRSPDGQVELDALAELAPDATRPQGGRWVVSLKWRSKRAGRKELEQLAGQAANLGALGWVIARDGFTPDALNYASQANIMTSSGEDLAQLARLLK